MNPYIQSATSTSSYLRTESSVSQSTCARTQSRLIVSPTMAAAAELHIPSVRRLLSSPALVTTKLSFRLRSERPLLPLPPLIKEFSNSICLHDEQHVVSHDGPFPPSSTFVRAIDDLCTAVLSNCSLSNAQLQKHSFPILCAALCSGRRRLRRSLGIGALDRRPLGYRIMSVHVLYSTCTLGTRDLSPKLFFFLERSILLI